MKYPLSQIKVGQRQRREFADITTLAESMQRLGQFHSIGLRPDGTLVWGMHRVMAAQSLGWPEIDAVVRDDLTEEMAFEIELEEDIRRKERTWQEEVIAIGQLFFLKARRARQNGTVFGVREMASYTNLGKTVVAEYVNTLGGALSKEPRDEELWACKTYTEALDMLRDRAEKVVYAELQARREAAKTAIVNQIPPEQLAALKTEFLETQPQPAPGSVREPDPTSSIAAWGAFLDKKLAAQKPASTIAPIHVQKLALRERAIAYNTKYSHLWNQQLICFVNPAAPTEQYLIGHWFVGGGNISSLYGSYQIEYLRRIETLFPDITGKREIVHLFSGGIPLSDNYTVVGLPDGDNKPDIVCDAHNLSSGLGFSPFLVYADPPYSVEDSEHYANSMVNRERVISECAVVLQPGGFLVWFDQALPLFSSNELELVGAISYIRSTGNRFRVVSIFRKPLCQTTLSLQEKKTSDSPSPAVPSPTLPPV